MPGLVIALDAALGIPLIYVIIFLVRRRLRRRSQPSGENGPDARRRTRPD
jgi:hypothetical protein